MPSKRDWVAKGLLRAALVAACLCPAAAVAVDAQDAGPGGLRVRGLPSVSYDADEGFGYGAALVLHQYGTAGRSPYEWTLQPTASMTTEGRRDFTIFFDAPRLVPGDWRVDVFLGLQEQIATPYYGIGNATEHDPALEDPEGANPYYYRFGRTRRSAIFNLQRPFRGAPVRALVGGGIVSTSVVPTPKGVGTTLYASELGASPETRWSNYVRVGVVWDTRDRETGTTRGSWSEALVQWSDEGLGSNVGFVRWTLTDRRYVPIGGRVVLAHRYLLQGVGSGAPVEELFVVQSSFGATEGLGGSRTVRGLLKNRYAGRGLVVWNAELRWRVVDVRFFGRAAHLVLSGFLDQGRVWAEEPKLGEAFSDLHRGYGAGVRGGLGEDFVAGFDVATSAGAGLQLYMGIGYAF